MRFLLLIAICAACAPTPSLSSVSSSPTPLVEVTASAEPSVSLASPSPSPAAVSEATPSPAPPPAAAPTAAVLGRTERVSVSGTGAQSNGPSRDPAISADGRYVAFTSAATNLVSGASGTHVYLRDRTRGTTELVSIGPSGAGGDKPSISADGRFVAFRSQSALVADDTNGLSDTYIRDRVAGTTARVSVSSSGAQGNGHAFGPPAISGDGRLVAFVSHAGNLVPDDTPGSPDVFVHDRVAKTTERVSISSSGAFGGADYDAAPAITRDGRLVAFLSSTLAPGETAYYHVYVRDRQTGTLERISRSAGGATANQNSFGVAISPLGRFTTFYSDASNLVGGDTNSRTDAFLRDRQAQTSERLSVGPGSAQANDHSYLDDAYGPAINADARYVAFTSSASNLVTSDANGEWDVFLRDRVAGTTTRISVSSAGAPGSGGQSYDPAISGDGRYVAFVSLATNLVSGDTNGASDVFVRDRGE